MGQELKEQTFYEILDVSPGATQQEIVEAFERAKIAYAPNSPALYSMFTREEASYLLKIIDEAYRTLGDHAKRQTYDQSINLVPRAAIRESVARPTTASMPANLTHFPKATKTATVEPKKTILTPLESGVLQEGYAQTRFGQYKIDQDMESQITTAEEFSGEFLAKIRNYKGITIEQLSRETRISRSYLNAIEAEDFTALPAAVFVRGFVSQFAKSLSLDTNSVASAYMKRFRKGKVD